MPDSNSWTPYLAIWAVLGPLITASAGAIWVRRTQVNDRRYAETEKAKERDSARQGRHEQRQQNALDSQYVETKQAVIEVLASADLYQAALAAAEVPPTEVERQSIERYGSSLARATATLSLLVDSEFMDLVVDMKNDCYALAQAQPSLPDSQVAALEKAFGVSVGRVAEAGRKCLANMVRSVIVSQ